MTRPKVLVVDDDDAIRLLVKARLAGDCDVFDADRGAEAIKVFEAEPIDLVLLDVMMPGMTGLEVCEKLKARTNEFLPVLLLTALNDQANRNLGLRAGADDYLVKPIDGVELKLRVRHFLRLREQDLRLRKQMVELATLSALKDDLTELLVHDMSNPLTSIITALHLVMSSEVADVDREMLELGLGASSRLKAVIDDLLQVNLLEQGKLRVVAEETRLDALVGEAIRTVLPVARAEQVSLSQSGCEEVSAHVDRRLLLRALENLLANGIRHTRGSMDVTVSRSSKHVVIAVCDRGRGVPDALKEGTFEKYGSLELDRANARRGFGIGLYMVRLVVEAHGGSVEVDDREGGGAVFRLLLPSRVP